jgi:hypothetical protein
VPLWPQIALTLFLLVLVPVYWRHYGPGNFLWFSDIALFLTTAALWLESPLLASMAALAVLLPEIGWNVDYFGRLLTGHRVLGLADYMFDGRRSMFLRALSLFHVVLPPLLVWAVSRLGYDPRALPAQAALAWIVLPAAYLLTSPEKNVDWVHGPRGKVQRRIPPLAWLGLLMVVFPLGIYVPTHLLLEHLFPEPAVRARG